MIARADGSVLYNFAVAVDDLDARDHARRPRRGPPLQHAQAAARLRGARRASRRSSPTCRCCTARTARSSPSATAPRRSRSCATPATCPRPSATTSRCSAGAPPTTRRSSPPHELDRSSSTSRACRRTRRSSTIKKLRWLNGRYIRELDVDELTARLEAFTGRDRPARRGRDLPGEDPDARRLLAAGGLPLRRPGRRPQGAREVARRRRTATRSSRPARRSRTVEPFDVERIEVALREVVEADPERKPKDVFQPIRVALAGTTVSPGIFESLAVLGRDEALRRIDAALATLRTARDPRRSDNAPDKCSIWCSIIRPRLPITGIVRRARRPSVPMPSWSPETTCPQPQQPLRASTRRPLMSSAVTTKATAAA